MEINCKVKFDDGLDEMLRKLENADELAMYALKGVKSEFEGDVKSALGAHDKTGQMSASVKATGPKKNQYGHILIVRPTGKDKRGVRNMAKAAWAEYGYFNKRAKRYVAPRPVLAQAVNGSMGRITVKMQRLIEEKAGIR